MSFADRGRKSKRSNPAKGKRNDRETTSPKRMKKDAKARNDENQKQDDHSGEDQNEEETSQQSKSEKEESNDKRSKSGQRKLQVEKHASIGTRYNEKKTTYSAEKMKYQVHKIPLKKQKLLNISQWHYLLDIQKNRDQKSPLPLLTVLHDGLKEALLDTLNDVKSTFHNQAMWVTLVLPNNHGQISGHLWFTSDKMNAVANFYCEKLGRILQSKKSITVDKSFGIYIHVMDKLKSNIELRKANLGLSKRRRAPKEFHSKVSSANERNDDEDGPWNEEPGVGSIPNNGPKVNLPALANKDSETYLMDVPTDDPRFQDYCLIDSVIISAAHVFRDDENVWLKQRSMRIIKLNSKDPTEREIAKKEIIAERNQILQNEELRKLRNDEMTFDNCLEHLSAHYDGDIIVHSLQDPKLSRDKIVYKYPKKSRTDTLIHILHEWSFKDEKKIGHCTAIVLIKKYKKEHGHACLFCNSRTKSNSVPAFHVCRHQDACETCFRYKIPKNELSHREPIISHRNNDKKCAKLITRFFKHKTRVYNPNQEDPFKFYCDSNGCNDDNDILNCVPDPAEPNKPCGFPVKTSNCQSFHKKHICKAYYFCNDCSTPLRIPKDMTRDEVHEIHANNCYDERIHFCRNCYKYHDVQALDQMCPIKCFTLMENHPKLAFLTMALEESFTDECCNCPERSFCDYHDKSISESRPNYLICAREVGKQGNFEYIERHSIPNHEEEQMSSQQHAYKPQHELSDQTKKSNFGNNLNLMRKKWKTIANKEFPIEKRNVLIKWLIEALGDPSYKNTTIITNQSVLRALMSFHRKVTKPEYQNNSPNPKILQFDNSIRFLDFENFINVEIPLEFKSWFPNINFKRNMNLTTMPPKIMYFNKSDTRDERRAKEEFYQRLDKTVSPWSFKEALKKHLMTDLTVMKKLALEIQNLSVAIQEKLKVESKEHKKLKEAPIVSPYSYSSYVQFMYTLLQNYSLQPNDVRIVKNSPLTGKVSRPQVVWEKRLKRKLKAEDPTFTLKGAFSSPSGAMRFGPRICDGYCRETKTVHEYLGTFYHACKKGPYDKENKTGCILWQENQRFVNDQEPEDLLVEVEIREAMLKDTYPNQVENVVHHWECDEVLEVFNEQVEVNDLSDNPDIDMNDESEKSLLSLLTEIGVAAELPDLADLADLSQLTEQMDAQKLKKAEELGPKKLREIYKKSLPPFHNDVLPHRLDVESGIYGGSSAVYQYYWKKEEDKKNRNFYYVDINSSYPNAARTCIFPQGAYQLTTEDEVPDLVHFDSLSGNYVFKESGLEAYGLILCDIIPKKGEKDPFLVYRTPDGRTLNPNCGACADSKSKRKCSHQEKQRVLHGVWTFQEINRAVSKHGYEVKRVYETLTYETASAFMKTFFDVLSHFLLMHKEVRNEPDNPHFWEDYCNNLNEKMDFGQNVKLQEDELQKKAELRIKQEELLKDKFIKKVLKFSMNAICGRLMKKNNPDYDMLVSDPYQIHEKIELISGFTFQDDTLIAHVQNTYGPKIQNPYNQMILGLYITSYGRLALDDLKTKVKNENNDLVYTDTDCCMFLGKKNLDESNFSNALGDLKNEIEDAKEIKSFVSLGIKRYDIGYENAQGEWKEIAKFCGVRPLANDVGKKLDSSSMKELIQDHNKELDIFQYLKTKSDWEKENKEQDESLKKKRDLILRRVVKEIKFNPLHHNRIFVEENYQSKPYGS